MPDNYRKAIAFSRQLFDAAEEIGFKFNILDIGGGFTGLPLTTGKFQKVYDETLYTCYMVCHVTIALHIAFFFTIGRKCYRTRKLDECSFTPEHRSK